jgi:hypothetical protein
MTEAFISALSHAVSLVARLIKGAKESGDPQLIAHANAEIARLQQTIATLDADEQAELDAAVPPGG